MTTLALLTDRHNAKLGILISHELDVDFRQLGEWVATLSSQEQAEIVVGLAEGLFIAGGNSGEMQLAYLAQDLKLRHSTSAEQVDRFVRSLYAQTQGEEV